MNRLWESGRVLVLRNIVQAGLGHEYAADSAIFRLDTL